MTLLLNIRAFPLALSLDLPYLHAFFNEILGENPFVDLTRGAGTASDLFRLGVNS